jgi:EAL domain-containing protein (putative c-di-GMP-specific phosphodiesterase class I)
MSPSVETHDQLTMLQAAGCTQAQGYLISRPRPLSEILEVLDTSLAFSLTAA